MNSIHSGTNPTHIHPTGDRGGKSSTIDIPHSSSTLPPIRPKSAIPTVSHYCHWYHDPTKRDSTVRTTRPETAKVKFTQNQTNGNHHVNRTKMTLSVADRILQLERENFELREELKKTQTQIQQYYESNGKSSISNVPARNSTNDPSSSSVMYVASHESSESSDHPTDSIPSPTAADTDSQLDHQQLSPYQRNHGLATITTHKGRNKIETIHGKLSAITAISERQTFQCAVALSWLTTFARDIDPTWTTLEVVQKVIIPRTNDKKERYTAQLASHEYGIPTYFISHRWSDRFREMVETVTSHCQTSGLGDPANIFLWIDIFAVNQHSGAAQAKDLDNLGAAIIRASKGTLLVMDPEGGVLTRIWCLYEIHRTVQERPGKDADLTLLMPKNVDVAVMKDVWTSLDVEKAEATVLADRDRILEDIRKSEVNSEALNHSLKSTLVKGSELQVDAARDALLSALVRSAQMVDLAGFSAKAAPLLQESILICEKLPYPEQPSRQLQLAQCEHELSRVLCSGLHMYQRSLPLCEKSLATRRKHLPAGHIDIAISLDRLGWNLACLKEYDQAEAAYKEARDIMTQSFPGDHINTAEILNNWAVLKAEIGQSRSRIVEVENGSPVTIDDIPFRSSLEMHQEAASMRRRLLGENHVLVAESMLNIAVVLRKLKRGNESLGLALTAVGIREKALGTAHIQTGDAYNSLALSYRMVNQWDLSIEYFTKVLFIRRSTYGPDDVRVGTTAKQLATMFEKVSRMDDTIHLLDNAISIFKTVGHHTQLLAVVTKQANLLIALNRPDDAVTMANKILFDMEHRCGEAAAVTTRLRLQLSRVLLQIGDYESSLTCAMTAIKHTRSNLDDPDALVSSLLQACQVHGKMNQYELGLSCADEAIQVCLSRVKAQKLLKSAYHTRSEFLKSLGRDVDVSLPPAVTSHE